MVVAETSRLDGRHPDAHPTRLLATLHRRNPETATVCRDLLGGSSVAGQRLNHCDYLSVDQKNAPSQDSTALIAAMKKRYPLWAGKLVE